MGIKEHKFLATIDSNGKFRQIAIGVDWSDEEHAYVIQRITGCYKGKLSLQPKILVERGKSGRSVTEQAKLQFDHYVKEYTDKGYKLIPMPADKYSEEELREMVGTHKTNREGLLKPMLAKQADQVTSKKTFDKKYYGSRKINGVRALIYWNEEKHRNCTASRGAMNYDVAAFYIARHPKLEEWLSNHPNIILDGELYKFGWTLNRISGLCRSQSTVMDGIELEYYLYDVIDTDNLDMPFEERKDIIQEFADDLNLSFNPEREWEDLQEDLKIQIVPQVEISGWDNIKKLHDEYVAEGWEGLVIRLASASYGPGKRTNDMIKIKQYISKTCRIVGIEQGLRLYDDMVFVMETLDGKRFKAKPKGSREIKIDYTNHSDDYIGKLGDIKYFEISPYGIPEQPVFESPRYDITEADL